jgi:hypothetical protein
MLRVLLIAGDPALAVVAVVGVVGSRVEEGGCLSGFGRLGMWSVVDGWADLADVDGGVDLQILQT